MNGGIREINGGCVLFDFLKFKNNYVLLHFFVNSLLNFILTIGQDVRVPGVKIVIALDELHKLLKDTSNKGYEDEDKIRRDRLTDYFIDIISEFRETDISFLCADNRPFLLPRQVIGNFGIQFNFTLKSPHNTVVSTDPRIQQLLPNLPNRRALVDYGPSARKFMIETKNFTPPRHRKVCEEKIKESQLTPIPSEDL